MEEFKKSNIQDLPMKHQKEHAGYTHDCRNFVPDRKSGQCRVNVYEVPPGNSMCPYHYHLNNEEVFYIISGMGCLLTPEGEQIVKAGDLLFFPANENGAHKLTNISETETLRYLDFDTTNDVDLCLYPHSGKIGIWGKDVNRLYRMQDTLSYYDGE